MSPLLRPSSDKRLNDYVKAAKNTPTVKPRVATPAERSERSEGSEIVPPHPLYAKSFLGQPAPELTVQKWLTDPPDTTGKFVLLDFWATWCGPCRRSIPELNEFPGSVQRQPGSLGLSSENEQAVRSMKEPKITYAVGIDTLARTEKVVEVKGIPHTMLIDPKGIVRFEGMPGYLNDQTLEKLLAKYSR